MNARNFLLPVMALLALAQVAVAGPDTESFGPAQAAADVIRAATKAEIAFLPAGVIKSDFKSGDLSKMLQFPSDQVVVVELTGAQVRSALERSVSLLPSPNPGFLQVSGITVTCSPRGVAGSRVKEVTVAGAALDASARYRVAMPSSLGRGGLGYFTVWKKEQIVETLPGTTVETLLKGKTGTENTPRWRGL
ncbi:MAG: 5'-nucleotidase C-terminal domain-containing protein [Fimbriimonadaceae bacterium]|nr:5'-nucleotidase C-terminal domain-containing protein [Fimbriimonadaceae bacterium]